MKVIGISFLALIFVFTTTFTYGQSEKYKAVVNNLAIYKQKKDLKFLSAAKRSIDSLIKTHADSVNLNNNVYKAIVNSTIVYVDTLNKLNQPANFFDQTALLVNQVSANKRSYKFEAEIGYSKRCIGNAYIRKGFQFVRRSDYSNAIQQFNLAQKFVPSFKQLSAYIAFANSKLGNLAEAARFYDHLITLDSARAAYIQTAANIYETLGDTSKALEIITKGRKNLPDDKYLIFEEASIYTNRKDYKSLEPLLPQLLEYNPNNPDVAYVAACCYDHLGAYDKAESLYLHVIELNNALFEPMYSLGLLYLRESTMQKGENADRSIGKAAEFLSKANEISPNSEKCLEVLKLVYTKTGNQYQINNIDNQLKQLKNP
jgi:tetratricopeptide (TPR) repeat protein